MTKVTGTFEFKAWDEKTWDGKDQREVQGSKLTHARIINQFSGGIEGESELQYVMFYDEQGHAQYHGLEQISGKLDGKQGTFVLHTEGKFDGRQAGGTWQVVANSGTDELQGLTGKGSFVAQLHENKTPYVLEFSFE